MVEQEICNFQVKGSTPFLGFIFNNRFDILYIVNLLL